MKLDKLPLACIDWTQLPAASQPGARGTALARTFEAGEIRLRLVEYSPDYLADHWCTKGHLVLLIEGRLTLELQGRSAIEVTAGSAVTLADDDIPHRAVSATGAKVFLVD